MKPRAVTVFIVILVGLLLWFLAAEVPLDRIFGLVGTATVVGACGVSLVALGMASLTHFFGRGYLKAFLTLGLLVEISASFAVFLLLGPPVSLLVIYLAVKLGAFYGSIAGTLGAIAYHVLRSRLVECLKWKRRS